MKPTKYWFVLCLVMLAVTVSACSLTRCSDDPACTRILFIGNSYTFVNDLPNTLLKLAQSGGKRLETGLAATGGWTLSDHLNSPESLAQIETAGWNFVVLQEQSEIPAIETARNSQMLPAGRELAVKVKAAGAVPLLFVTWGHRLGLPENGLPGYEDMQLAINYGYKTLAQPAHLSMVPVGTAWLKMRRFNPEIELWQEDGSHPNEAGTYLAACVFYAAIYHTSPEGLSYMGNLSSEDAGVIQAIAAGTVIGSEKKWNLP